jgi:hypothetical protein
MHLVEFMLQDHMKVKSLLAIVVYVRVFLDLLQELS